MTLVPNLFRPTVAGCSWSAYFRYDGDERILRDTIPCDKNRARMTEHAMVDFCFWCDFVCVVCLSRQMLGAARNSMICDLPSREAR